MQATNRGSGAVARPAVRIEYPHPWVSHNTLTRIEADSPADWSAVARFAMFNDRIRKRCVGMAGALCLRPLMNVRIVRTTDSTSVPVTPGDAHPHGPT